MVIGDPYKFAIILDEVPQWNPGNYSFQNGILFYCFDGELFPTEILNAALSYETHALIDQLGKIPMDHSLFAKDKDDAFVEIYRRRYPNDGNIEEDYRYDIAPQCFSDNGYKVFAVKGTTGIRILANHLSYNPAESTHDLSGLNTLEAFITNGELDTLVHSLQHWREAKYPQ